MRGIICASVCTASAVATPECYTREEVSGDSGKPRFMPKKILVVEDNPELLEMLRSYLKATGFAVATAANGIEALKKARSVSPNLVLLDLVLPELDGFAVYETLRKLPATASVPILIVTGLSHGLGGRNRLGTDGCEIIHKPVNPKHLVTRMKDLLGQSRTRSRSAGAERAKLPEPAGTTPTPAADRSPGLKLESRLQPLQASAARRH